VIGDEAHHGIDQRVGQARQGGNEADERGVHAQPEVEHDDHAADRRGEQVVDERPQPVDDLAPEGDAVFGRGDEVDLLALLRAADAGMPRRDREPEQGPEAAGHGYGAGW
jgi:hypothetical protein